MNDIILETKGLGKSFNGNWVLKDVDFDLRRGEIHALVGENGAGKSTFIKMLSGVYHPDAGSIELEGSAEDITNVAVSEKLGIRTVHQEINLVPYFSIYENVFIGSEMTKRIAGIKVVDKKNMRKRSQEVLSMMDIHIDPKTSVAALNATMQKVVQICSVLVYDPKIVIFDEPTAALGVNEQKRLLEIIRKLKERGLTIIYISHNLEEVELIADRCTVFRNGEKVGLLERDQMKIENLIPMMLGNKTYNNYKRDKSYATDEVILEYKNVSTHRLQDVSFQLHKGEIIGFAGTVGAGKSETAQAVFGIDKLTGGQILVDGKEYKHTTGGAIAAGVALVPEERRIQGIIPDFTLTKNVTLAFLNKWVKRGVIQNKNERTTTDEYIKRLSVRTTDATQFIKNLSGGNQQKVILARWLAGDFKIGVFDEPTKGIDIKAKEDIYILIDQLASEGKGVMMMSSYLPELLTTCDRIFVMKEGKIAGEFSTHDFEGDLESQITKVMLGGNINE